MIPQRKFYFIRHGQTDWNVKGRMQGHTDIPLNETGVGQARAAALRLKGAPIGVVVSSDLLRARATAEVIAGALGVPLVFDSGLRERRFGSLEGRLAEEVRKEFGLRRDETFSRILPPDAEQWPQTLQRARETIARLLEEHGGSTVLFVSHGAFFRALYEQTHNALLEARNATPYLFSPGADGWLMGEV